MSTKVKNAAKANVNVETANVPNLEKINIDAFATQLEGVSIKEKNTISRKGLYKYSSEEMAEIKKDGGELSKKIRNQARRKTDAFLSNIALKLKAKDVEGAKSVAGEFIEYYKERFILNDFTLDSVRESKSLSDTERIIYSIALKFASEI